MKTNNLIVTANNLDIIKDLKKVGVTTFLFPLKDYSVGFLNTFTIDDIRGYNAHIFINRILTSEDIDNLKIILNNLPNNIKGIIFDDLGIMQIIKDLKIEKILYLNHIANNYVSINYYLEYVDSVIISTDITETEIRDVLANVKKPLVLYCFGFIPVMYSRRLLLTNYQKHYRLKLENTNSIEDKTMHNKFNLVENEYGTVFYTEKPYNALELKDANNIKYNLINTVLLTDNEVIDLVNSIINNKEINIDSSRYFLDKKTIYKLRGDDNE